MFLRINMLICVVTLCRSLSQRRILTLLNGRETSLLSPSQKRISPKTQTQSLRTRSWRNLTKNLVVSLLRLHQKRILLVKLGKQLFFVCPALVSKELGLLGPARSRSQQLLLTKASVRLLQQLPKLLKQVKWQLLLYPLLKDHQNPSYMPRLLLLLVNFFFLKIAPRLTHICLSLA